MTDDLFVDNLLGELGEECELLSYKKFSKKRVVLIISIYKKPEFISNGSVFRTISTLYESGWSVAITSDASGGYWSKYYNTMDRFKRGYKFVYPSNGVQEIDSKPLMVYFKLKESDSGCVATKATYADVVKKRSLRLDLYGRSKDYFSYNPEPGFCVCGSPNYSRNVVNLCAYCLSILK
jgi:hypothetical protein